MKFHRLKSKFKLTLAISTLVIAATSNACKHTSEPLVLSNDGTWCWFSDPRAIVAGDELVTGFVTEDGSVKALQYDLKSGNFQQAMLNEKLEVDDHNNPAFAELSDGSLLAFYTRHHNRDLYMNRLSAESETAGWSEAISINPNGAVDLERFGDDKYTYANPFVLKNENNRIYMFGRWIGFKPNMTWSDDGGKTWADGRVVVSPKPFSWGQRPYVKYYSDGLGKIHLVFTDGHPRDEPFNSVYYACYYEGAFHRADGSIIATMEQLPFEPKEATLIYDARETGHRAWVYDLFADEKGQPAVAYARYPTEEEHLYHYAWFDGEKWNDRAVVNSGKWFPETHEGRREREPHYSGGLTIDPNKAHTLYVSREVNGVFEIEKFSLNKGASEWNIEPLTQNSSNDQIRPYAAKNYAKETIVLWNSVDRYIHYTNFRTAVIMQRIK